MVSKFECIMYCDQMPLSPQSFERECTQKALSMHYKNTSGHLWAKNALLWSSSERIVTWCPHRAEGTAQEGLLTKVHRGKNLWGSYEVVCFSSEWRKRGWEEKGAVAWHKDPVGAWCDFYHLKTHLTRLSSKRETGSGQHGRNVRQKVAGPQTAHKANCQLLFPELRFFELQQERLLSL